MKAVPRNVIRYTAGKGEARATISGIGYGRYMETVSGHPDGIRTMIFPATVRKVRQGLFCGMKSLVSVVLNEGLEALGTKGQLLGQPTFCGVFQESGVKRVKFSSTLKMTGKQTFMGCNNLRSVQLLEGLVEIGLRAFRASGL